VETAASFEARFRATVLPDKRKHGGVREAQTKALATDRLRLNHRTTPRLHKLAIRLTGAAFTAT